MTSQLPLSEVIVTAKQKLSSASACLNDSTAFFAAVSEFDQWMSAHKDTITALTSEQQTVRHEIEQLIHQLTRLELQAHYNISLVAEMQSYIDGKLERVTPLQNSYHR